MIVPTIDAQNCKGRDKLNVSDGVPDFDRAMKGSQGYQEGDGWTEEVA